jgi:hypothetical protein
MDNPTLLAPPPTTHRVRVGRKVYKVTLAPDGAVIRVNTMHAVRGEIALDVSGRIARAAIAKVPPAEMA